MFLHLIFFIICFETILLISLTLSDAANLSSGSSIHIKSEEGYLVIKLNPKYFRKGEVNHLRGNFDKANKILNWKPKVNLKKLIKIMINEEMKNIKLNKFY